MKKRPKILIVDDRIENLIALEKILVDLDVESVRARSGNEALKKTLEHDFAIALMDIQMPGMDGFETVELMRQEKKTMNLPLIFISAVYKEEYYQIRGMETGAVDFITKPIVPKILASKVRVFLDLYDHRISLENEIQQRKQLEKDLRKAHDELEVKVEERTAELSEANEALQESEEFNFSLLNNAPNPIIVLNPDTSTRYVNPALENLTGFSSSELIGSKAPYPWWTKETLAKTSRDLKEAMHKGEKQLENLFQKKNGERFWVEITSVPIMKNGEFKYYLANWVDITNHKEAEEALKKSEEKFKAIFNESLDVVMIMDSESGEILSVNQSVSHILGYENKGLLEKHFSILFPSESKLTGNNLLEKLFIHGSVFESQEFVRADGSVLPMDLTATVVPWDKGKAILATFRDVSERKILEDQFRQAQKMEAIGVLAGGVAHDFNNLLTTIIGCSDLMMMSIGKDHELREDLEDIKKAGYQAASLTRQLLAFSRRQILEPKVIDLNDVIPDMDRMLRRLIGEDIDLETVLTPDLGRVEADPGQIEQIIMNLAVNARDAMPRGGRLTIETANMDLDVTYARNHMAVTPGPYVMMAISDSGTGMDEETLSKVFDPFFTTKEVGKGTGLGLSTIYGIVKQSNGNIWAYSEPGKGTTFKIYLPRVEKEIEETEAVEAAAESLTGSEAILVVEDNEMVRDLVQTIFQRHGYSVLTAQDGEEAIKVSKEHDGPIHLMVTDVVMPNMSGKELAERLNALRPDMKVLYMSGYTDNAIVHHGVLAQEMVFIQKPFTPESLARKVREVIDKIED